MMEPYKILYEDSAIIVIHKMPGVPVETRRIGNEDIVSLLKKHVYDGTTQPYVGLVHRLDQPVEGLMVVAKNERAAARLSKSVRDKSSGIEGFNKVYEATVYGTPLLPRGTFTNYIYKDPKSNISEIVDMSDSCYKNNKNVKKAVLNYSLISEKDNVSILEIELITGRHHQIRAQLAYNNMPILGDMKYGNASSIAYSKEHEINNIRLIAKRLSFIHPLSGNIMEYSL